MDREQQCMKLKSKITTSFENNSKQQKLLIRQSQHKSFVWSLTLLYLLHGNNGDSYNTNNKIKRV